MDNNVENLEVSKGVSEADLNKKAVKVKKELAKEVPAVEVKPEVQEVKAAEPEKPRDLDSLMVERMKSILRLR